MNISENSLDGPVPDNYKVGSAFKSLRDTSGLVTSPGNNFCGSVPTGMYFSKATYFNTSNLDVTLNRSHLSLYVHSCCVCSMSQHELSVHLLLQLQIQTSSGTHDLGILLPKSFS